MTYPYRNHKTCADWEPLPERFSVMLPLPPSTNALFATVGKRRVKSEAYKAWLNEARYAVLTRWRELGKPAWPDKTPMLLAIDAGIGDRRRDLGNIEKAVSDILAKELPVPDDRWTDLIILKRTTDHPGFAHVVLGPLDPPG